MILTNKLNFSQDIEIKTIKNFLDKNLKSIDAERNSIYKREKNGEFYNSLDDFSNELFPSIIQEEITVRSVFYEINAIIESRIQILVCKYYQDSKEKYTKDLKFIGDREEYEMSKIKKIKSVTNLDFGIIIEILEKEYKFKFAKLASWKKIRKIRQTVNDFKHRRGFKDPCKCLISELSNNSQPNRKDAHQAIDQTKTFLIEIGKIK